MPDAYPRPKFVERVCGHCGKPKGTVAFRLIKNGKPFRDYFHPKCADIVKRNLGNDEGGKKG